MRILRPARKPMTVIGLAAALVLCSHKALLAFDGPASVVGRWRSVEVNAAGLGSTIEFRGDGTLDFTVVPDMATMTLHGVCIWRQDDS